MKYKLIGTTENYLKLRSVKGNKFIMVKPDKVVITKDNTFILKKDIKHKELSTDIIVGIALGILSALLFTSWLLDEPSGYYGACDTGSGIHYEWMEGGDE